MNNPLLQLKQHGQSVWIDYIRRDLIQSGRLKQYIEEDGVCGVTSNPAIFEKAIAGSNLYDQTLQTITDSDPKRVFERLAIEDIQAACDVFKSVYEQSRGDDGFVSLEVSPHLANDTEGTVTEAKRLFMEVNRPNVMIKVPATPAGLPAIESLIASGLNINVTLIFSQTAYEAVCDAYIKGLERRLQEGLSIEKIRSVASVFISRIDSLVDNLLEQKASENPSLKEQCEKLMGKTGIANLKLVYQRYKAIFHDSRFAQLAESGASRQRPLWASTSTKNPVYSDVLYVEPLIGPETVNTLPIKTLDAFRDHGVVRETLESELDQAKIVLEQVEAVGISLDALMDQLLREGVRKFVEPFEQLLHSIVEKRLAVQG